jgi:hypothetical protein
MTAGEMIQFGALLVALISLVWQQTRLFNQRRRQDLRIEMKLRLFYLLQKDDLTEEQIIQKLEKTQPTTEGVRKPEIRKALYEMLSDETAFFQKNGTYRAHWRTVKDRIERSVASKQP